MTAFEHKSVLLKETIELLNIRPDGIYVDGTVGGGGHSRQIALILDPARGGRLICLDRDEEALKAASAALSEYSDRVELVHSNYADMTEVLRERGIEKINGLLLDLGVSSYQLDAPERGFSYRSDAPLDMRMDRSAPLSAREVVNCYSAEKLARIIRDYGEERYALNVARRIVAEREKHSIETTGQLSEIVAASIPGRSRRERGHPAKRTFQAIRIEVNSELEALSDALDKAVDVMENGGRIAVISFHSLEDRIVKRKFRLLENPCICPKNFPVCVCGRKPRGRVIGRGSIRPGALEINDNPRSKSASLRVFEVQGESL